MLPSGLLGTHGRTFDPNAFSRNAVHRSRALGYIFLLEDCAPSIRPVGVKEPHFKVFPEFRNSSYAKRYELFCRRLVLERHYDAAAFLMSNAKKGANGEYSEPAADLTFQMFARSLVAYVAAFSGRIKEL